MTQVSSKTKDEEIGEETFKEGLAAVKTAALIKHYSRV